MVILGLASLFAIPMIIDAASCWGQQLSPSESKLAHSNRSEQSLREYVSQNEYRQAYGMYVQGKKFGWIIEGLRLGEHNQHEVAIYEDESYFSTEFLGEKEVSTSTSYVVYSLEGDGPIVYARYITIEDGRKTTIECVTDENQLEVKTTVGKEVATRSVPRPKDTLRDSYRFDRWLRGRRERGDRIDTWLADFEEADVDVPEHYVFQRAFELKREGETVDVVEVDMEVLGGEGTLILTREGRLVRGSLSGFIELIGEEESTVKEMDDSLVDLFAASAVTIEKDLGDPKLVDRLVLEIRNAGDFKFPESHRQQSRENEDGSLTLTLRREHRRRQADLLTESEREVYLAATPATASDHPVIVARAKRIIGKETQPRRQAERIVRWVFLNLDSAGASNSTNAIQILDQRAGDCSEHALLCVALARAVGLPAREISGVMYGGEGSGFFAWHAWVEIHDGHQWVAVDPTWNQLAVDATHVKFAHGSRDLAWTNVMGKLNVTVQEFKVDQGQDD